MLPRPLLIGLVILVVLSLIPPTIIIYMRTAKTDRPRIHLIPDMDNQPKFKAQHANPMFADGRSMRMPVAGTVARGDLRTDHNYFEGKVGETWTEDFPIHVDLAVIKRGQERFGIYCTPCHGVDGRGQGVVSVRADSLQEGTWVPPTNLHDDVIQERPNGHLFNTITHGIRNMPAYGDQIEPKDRWAIIAYVRALQRSQKAGIEDVPPEQRATLK